MTRKDVFLKKKAEFEQVRAKAKEDKQFIDSCGECKFEKIPAAALKMNSDISGLFTNTDGERQSLKESMGGKGQAIPIIVTSDNYVIDGHHRAHILKELNKPVHVVKLGVEFASKTIADWKAWSYTANLVRRMSSNIKDVKEVMEDFCEEMHISPSSLKASGKRRSILTSKEIKKAVAERTGKEPSDRTIDRARRAILETEGVIDKPIVEVYTIPSDRTRGNKKEEWFSDGKHSFRNIEEILREEFDLWLEDMHDISEYSKPMEYMTVEVKLNMRRVK